MPLAKPLVALMLCCSCGLATLAAPPVARVEVVEDRYFDTTIADPYRWMELPGAEGPVSPELRRWLDGQNEHTRAALDAPARGRAAWLARIQQLQAGTATVRFVQRAGDRYFFLMTPNDGKDAQLMVRPVAGGSARVLLTTAQLGTLGKRASIDFYSASRDGARVVVAVSHGGAEDWAFRFVETSSGRLLPDVVPRIADPFPSWAGDGRGIYYTQLALPRPGAAESERYLGIRGRFHALGRDADRDPVLFGHGVDPKVPVPNDAFLVLRASDDGRWLLAHEIAGTDYGSPAIWLRDLEARRPAWRKVVEHADQVAEVQVAGGRGHALSGRVLQTFAPDPFAANGRILSFDLATETIADARTELAPGATIFSADTGYLGVARDALYAIGKRDGFDVMWRLPFAPGAAPAEVALPATGNVTEFAVDGGADGVTFGLDAPNLAPRLYRLDPATGACIDTGLRVPDAADYSGIEVQHLEFPSADGVMVPLTLIGRRGLARDGRNPVLLVSYGAYGAIAPVGFVAPNLAWYERGGMLAFAHIRGGGEKGVAWHEVARKTGKQKSIDDVVAAARYLIGQGWTAPPRLAIAGKSAGGIPTGGAITQHPELFGAAIFRVAVTDLLRIEGTAGGGANTVEYGSVKVPEEFAVLRQVSGYANVKDGVAYPAVLLETGINDPRVPSWQLAKMTARLQAASSSGKPVLLRVDYDAGHGLGNDKRQVAALMADEFAFLAWALGMEPKP